MTSTTITVRIDTDTKERLESLAQATGRSRSFLTAEAIAEYLTVNEWQVAGIRQAMAGLDRGEAVDHGTVSAWVDSWGEDDGPAPSGA